MDIIQYIFWGFGLLTLVGTLIPLLREQTWWLRAWTYARLQILCICLILVSTYVLLFGLSQPSDKAYLLGAGLISVICLRDILPFTPIFPKQTRRYRPGEKFHPISMVVGNVLMENDKVERLLQSINNKNPDIVFMVETDEAWRDRLSALEKKYPYTHLLPLEKHNGMLFYSRYEITDVQERYLVQDHIPSLTIDINVAGDTVTIYALHPRPPRVEDDTEDLDTELKFIAHEVGHHIGPVIVTGDLNDVGWSSTTKKFLRVSGLSDPRRGRGLYNSFNAKVPIVRWPLDHVFHSRHFALMDMERLPAFGSDHFPIYIKFALLKP